MKASVQSFTNISYILKNKISSEDLIEQFEDLLEIIDIAYQDKDALIKSINYYKTGKMKDFEDSVQFVLAELNKCDYIVTRDKAFFDAEENAITPNEALNII